MTTSIAQEEHQIDPNKCTAILYPVSENGEYIVEIHSNGSSEFIKTFFGNDMKKFASLSEAKNAAKNKNVETCFQALAKTYQEVETEVTDSSKQAKNSKRFDYLPVSLEEDFEQV